MPSRTLPGIGLNGAWAQGDPWTLGGNENWLRSSVLTQLAVESATTSLPASPLNGVIYIVPAVDTHGNQVAARDNGAWVYMPPAEGWTAYVRDTGVLMNYDGAAWVPSTAPLSAALAAANGSAGVGFLQAGTGAVARSLEAKGRDVASVKDFGAVGNGTADDTAAVLAALAASDYVIIPADCTLLISSTILVQARKKVVFLSAQGNTSSTLPRSRFIKKSTMTTPALQLESCAVVIGGGLSCQGGNTGDGVQLIGNGAELIDFYADGAGGIGVRVGRDDTIYANVNSCRLRNVRSNNNGSHGIYAHDNSTTSASAGSADANAGSMLDCSANGNGGDGIKLGNAWWWTISNPLTQSNAGWGLNLSSTIVAPSVVAQCRYANIFGGDFNEGNVAGSANIAGYAASVFLADANQVLSVPGTACSVYGGNATIAGAFSGVSTTLSQASGATPYLLNVKNPGNASNGRGVGILFSPPNGSNTTRSGGQIAVEQSTTNLDLFRFSVNVSGVMTDILKLDPNGMRVIPPVDATVSLGATTLKWVSVFSSRFYPGATGSTNFWTSGAGTPEGNLTAPVGSMYTRTDGGAATTLYVKESGAGNTGWVAK